ncbi:MAG: hypothetical protein LBP31_03105 [Holosporales bacterium]|jgi:hypothetical protein|nr:hypothetical protein [Holosporales bacterium]
MNKRFVLTAIVIAACLSDQASSTNLFKRFDVTITKSPNYKEIFEAQENAKLVVDNLRKEADDARKKANDLQKKVDLESYFKDEFSSSYLEKQLETIFTVFESYIVASIKKVVTKKELQEKYLKDNGKEVVEKIVKVWGYKCVGILTSQLADKDSVLNEQISKTVVELLKDGTVTVDQLKKNINTSVDGNILWLKRMLDNIAYGRKVDDATEIVDIEVIAKGICDERVSQHVYGKEIGVK